MGGNPKSSEWYAMKRSDRKRPKIEVTIDPDLLERLDAYVAKLGDKKMKRSNVVEDAIRAFLARKK